MNIGNDVTELLRIFKNFSNSHEDLLKTLKLFIKTFESFMLGEDDADIEDNTQEPETPIWKKRSPWNKP